MNELLKKIRAKVAASSAATRAFYARNKMLVLGGLTMLSILLIVWARLGFTLDFNRFYAANTCTQTSGQFCYPGGANGPGECPAPNTSGIGTCDVGRCCKPPGAQPAPPAPAPAPGDFTGRKPTPTELRAFSRSEGWSEDFERFSDGVLQDWINCCWNIGAKKFNSRRAGVPGLWEKPTECPGGQVPGGPNEEDPCVPLPAEPAPAPATPPSPGTLRLDSCANGTARLSWTPGANAIENVLQRIYTDNTNSWASLTSAANTTSYTDSIPTGISYNYRVKSGPNTVSNTVTCANSGGSTAPASITTRCEGWPTPRVIVNWTIPSDAVQNTIRRTGTGGSFTDTDALLVNPPAGTTTHTDTTIQTGATYGYMYRPVGTVNPRSDITINAASCGGPTPTPTPTQTTLPVDDPVICAPAEQTVAVNQQARLTATGGNDSYQWASDAQTESGAAATFTYGTTGSKTVTITSGTSTAECLVVVVAPAAPVMNLTVLGRNVSSGGPEGTTVGALGGQQVEVVVRVRNSSADVNLANILVRSALPPGLVYIAQSTTVNNAPATVESITAGGLSIGSLGPSQEASVRFRTRVNGASFPVGTTQASIVTQVSADGGGERSGSVVVSVTRAAAGVAPPAAVQTGPGDAVLVALLVSGIVTMLYVSYTHSPFFRRHEAEALSEDQGPMDFRG